MRSLLLCGLPKASLSRVSLMAREAGLASMNATALFKRLCGAEEMLRELFMHALRHAADREERWGDYRLVVVDGTTLCGPGATGTDQRLHVVYDLGSGLPRWVEQTGPEGGESLRRYAGVLGSGDLVMGDTGYGHARGLSAALHSGAHILVRFEFFLIRLLEENDLKITPEEAEARVPATGTVEFPAFLENWPGPLRVIGSRNPKGRVVWLITDLASDELPVHQVRKLYGRRWQIELFFKRLKSLLDLGEMPTRDGPTARAWIWAKLLLAALAVLIADERFSPWGCPAEQSEELVGEVRMRPVGSRQSAARASRPQATSGTAQGQAQTPREDAQTVQLLEA